MRKKAVTGNDYFNKWKNTFAIQVSKIQDPSPRQHSIISTKCKRRLFHLVSFSNRKIIKTLDSPASVNQNGKLLISKNDDTYNDASEMKISPFCIVFAHPIIKEYTAHCLVKIVFNIIYYLI